MSTTTTKPKSPPNSEGMATEPPGYKQTEFGLVPAEWETLTLGALELRGDVKLYRGNVISQKDIDRNPGDYPIYSSSVHSNGLFGRYGHYMFDEELITWSVDGGGHFFHRPKHRFSVTNVCGYLRIRSQSINYRFLAFQLQLLHGRQAFDYTLKAHPSVIRGVYTLALPSITEQRAIAEALSDVDGLIGALDKLIAKKRAIKQAAMQQLLTGKTCLPGFSGEWMPTRMKRVGSTYGGLSGKTKADFGIGNALYVTFLNVLENVTIDYEQLERVRVTPGESQNAVRKGDLLFNGTSETPGDLAMGAVVRDEVDDLYLNSFCFGFRIHDRQEHDALFVAYFFRGSVGRSIMYALAQGATRYNMSKGQFLDLELSLPEHDEQQAIATVLSDMDAEIAALERRRDKTEQIKQGMMQSLLTGRVRLVKAPEAEANA